MGVLVPCIVSGKRCCIARKYGMEKGTLCMAEAGIQIVYTHTVSSIQICSFPSTQE